VEAAGIRTVDAPVGALALGEIDDQRVVASGMENGVVAISDQASGLAVGVPFTGHSSAVWSVAMTALRGNPAVAVSGGSSAEILVWDPGYRSITNRLLGHTSTVNAVARAIVNTCVVS
jgi:WD40 repeat protein